MGELREQDLSIEVYGDDVAGLVTGYECSVRVTHVPSGTVAVAHVPPCRSQVAAKAQCLADLREALG